MRRPTRDHRVSSKTLGGSSVYAVRDRKVASSGVTCPECRAAAGSPCVTKAGTVTSKYHRCRRTMALRAGF